MLQDHEISTLALEVSQFIQVFAPVIRESTPHLYLSAMPQTPSSSPLRQLWLHHLQNDLSVTLAHPPSWPAEILTLQGHTSAVTSVAYSPDGSHIVSGSRDKTIRVWNPTTGQCTAGPFQGHTATVTSVAYSPDGSHIVSGSWDNTIRVWNPTTGQCMAGPFQGHTETVSSVAYSPDGSHIVSGSRDNTIRVWNPTTGQCMAGPFLGHNAHFITVLTPSVEGPASFMAQKMYQQADGWIELSNGACFCWVPPWGRNGFCLPIHSLVISEHEPYQLDCMNFMYGDSWISCWK